MYINTHVHIMQWLKVSILKQVCEIRITIIETKHVLHKG